MKGEVEGKRGNASPQTPRCYETPHDISLSPLFFVPLFHPILVTRSENARYPGNGSPRFPLLKFVVETFLFSRPRVFSSRPIKYLIVTALFAIALAGIRIGRILREKQDSHPLLGSVSHGLGCLDAPAVLPTRQLLRSRLPVGPRLMTHIHRIHYGML